MNIEHYDDLTIIALDSRELAILRSLVGDVAEADFRMTDYESNFWKELEERL